MNFNRRIYLVFQLLSLVIRFLLSFLLLFPNPIEPLLLFLFISSHDFFLTLSLNIHGFQSWWLVIVIQIDFFFWNLVFYVSYRFRNLGSINCLHFIILSGLSESLSFISLPLFFTSLSHHFFKGFVILLVFFVLFSFDDVAFLSLGFNSSTRKCLSMSSILFKHRSII